MRRLTVLPALLLLAAPPGPAQAQTACDPVQGLAVSAGEPRLQAVSLDRARARFLKDGTQQRGCPNDTAACATQRYLVSDDRVIVTATEGDYVCATFTGYPPTFPTTSGFLRRAALVDVPVRPNADWRGRWRSGGEQEIDIKPAPDGALALEGHASFGADDPDRVARGAVNIGRFSATVTPAAGKAAFTLDLDDKVQPYDANPGDDTVCRIRLWRLGPYLVAADNLRCGGLNVTFTGVYARERKPS